MFLNEFRHNIDEKGRMTIPAPYRELLGGEAYISLSFDPCLTVWPAPAFLQMRERIASMSLTDPMARLLRHMFFTKAARVEFDKAGRILLPQHLRVAVQLESDAVVAGVGETFEIWSPVKWAPEDQKVMEALAHPEQFEAFNLPLR